MSLPRKWALRNHIKKGDELDIKEDGNRIIVSVEKTPDVEATTLQLTTADKFLRRSIDALYRYGYDEIEVKYEDPAVVDQIQIVTSELLGFEIVSQGQNSCVIKNIAGNTEIDFDSLLRRIFMMVSSMMEDCYQYLSRKEYSSLPKIKHLDTVINKFTNFSERVLNKMGYKEPRRTCFVFCIVYGFEQISDEIKEMAAYLNNAHSELGAKLTFSKDVLELYQQMQQHFNLFYSAFYSKNVDVLVNKKNLRFRMLDRITRILETKKGVDAVIARHVYAIITNVQHMSTMVV